MHGRLALMFTLTIMITLPFRLYIHDLLDYSALHIATTIQRPGPRGESKSESASHDLFLCIYPPICHFSVYLSIYLSIYRSTYHWIHLAVHLYLPAAYLPTYLHMFFISILTIYRSINLPNYSHQTYGCNSLAQPLQSHRNALLKTRKFILINLPIAPNAFNQTSYHSHSDPTKP